MSIPNDQAYSTDFRSKQEIEYRTGRRSPDVMLEVSNVNRPPCDRSTHHRLGLAHEMLRPARGLTVPTPVGSTIATPMMIPSCRRGFRPLR